MFAQNLLLLIGQSDETNRQKKKQWHHFHLLHKIATPETRHSGLNVCYIFADFSGNKPKKQSRRGTPLEPAHRAFILSLLTRCASTGGCVCVCSMSADTTEPVLLSLFPPVLSCPLPDTVPLPLLRLSVLFSFIRAPFLSCDSFRCNPRGPGSGFALLF